MSNIALNQLVSNDLKSVIFTSKAFSQFIHINHRRYAV